MLKRATLKPVIAPDADPEADQQGAPPKAAVPAAVLAPVVRSRDAILVDAVTGKVLWARNPNAVRPIASTTKMLTAILLLEARASG